MTTTDTPATTEAALAVLPIEAVTVREGWNPRTGDDDTQVVLGKALSPKLFVSYGISIAEAINTVKLRYSLNPRWSLNFASDAFTDDDAEEG